MNCEICGRDIVGSPLTVKIESSLMKTCKACAKLGERTYEKTNVERPKGTFSQRRSAPVPKKEKTFDIVDDYSTLIRKNREKMGLTQDQLGSKINEKGSVISRIETRHMEPDIRVAKKLERFFSITLLEEPEI
jgi:putative transcription factor